jgi:cephalosporin hydroxylase
MVEQITLLDQYNLKNYNTDKNTLHSYIENFYSPVLTPYKNNTIKILEIGVRHGGSIQLWRDFFINGEVYGIDDASESIVYPEGCNIILGDAYNEKTLDSLPKDFDFIIDDGPHTLESQQSFLKMYINLIKEGGLIIIEDISSIENAYILKKEVSNDFNSEIVDLRGVKGRYDDIILWVKK